MNYFVLASGSKGNSTLIQGQNNKYILIDFGISQNEFIQKINQLNIDIENIVAVFFTHSHPDHLRSKRTVLNLFPLEKIYCSRDVLKTVEENYIDPLMSLQIDEFKVMTFPLSHDAPCIGFVIFDGQEKLTYFTDTGYLKYSLFPLIENSDHFLVESNHDENLLLASRRSIYLKKRILSPHGHLSNEDVSLILKEVIGNNTKSICILHLSQECNDKELALNTIKKVLIENSIDISCIDFLVSDQYNIINYLKKEVKV